MRANVEAPFVSQIIRYRFLLLAYQRILYIYVVIYIYCIVNVFGTKIRKIKKDLVDVLCCTQNSKTQNS